MAIFIDGGKTLDKNLIQYFFSRMSYASNSNGWEIAIKQIYRNKNKINYKV